MLNGYNILIKMKKGEKNMLEEYEDIITAEELSIILKIGKNRSYELLRTGEIKGFRLGKPWKIPKIAVEEYLRKKGT